MKILPTARNELDLFALYFLLSFLCLPLFFQLLLILIGTFFPLSDSALELAYSPPALALSVLIGGSGVIWRSHRLGIYYKIAARFRYWALAILVAVAINLIEEVFERSFVSPLENLDARFETDFWTLMLVIFLAPIFEEFVFRGLLFTWLCQKYSLYLSAALTTLIFTLIHFQVFFGLIYESIALLAVGIALMVLRIASRSLGPCMLAHCLNNALAVLI